jgi:MFS family permease
VAPVAGRLSARYGNRPFLTAGLLLHAAGRAWIAAIASSHTGFERLPTPLILSGAGIALVMPTVSHKAIGSVPASDVGVASGINSTIRALGGVFGVALLADIFTRPDVSTDPAAFASGFSAALWAGAAISLAGVLAALSAGARRRGTPAMQSRVADTPALVND